MSAPAFADNASKHDKIVELIEIINLDSVVDAMYSSAQMIKDNRSVSSDLNPSEQTIVDKYYTKLLDLIKRELSWKKMQPDMVDIYAKYFQKQKLPICWHSTKLKQGRR